MSGGIAAHNYTVAVTFHQTDNCSAEVWVRIVSFPVLKFAGGFYRCANEVAQMVELTAILKEPIVILNAIWVHPIELFADLILIWLAEVAQVHQITRLIVCDDVHNIHQQ